MKKIQFFVARHKIATFFTIAVFLCLVYTCILMQLEAPLWGIFLLDLFLAFIVYVYVEYCPGRIIRKALKELNENCNPYPLVEETEILLTYKNSALVQQVLLIDHAVGLREIGEYRKNLELLKTLNIDKASGTSLMNKVVYYNNLMDACGLLGMYEEAEIWYAKLKLIYEDITNQKQLEFLTPVIQRAEVLHYYCTKEYDRALSILREIHPKDKRSEVDEAMLHARIAIAMGDRETAEAKLQFVIENGNRLYVVTEAGELLVNLGKLYI